MVCFYQEFKFNYYNKVKKLSEFNIKTKDLVSEKKGKIFKDYTMLKLLGEGFKKILIIIKMKNQFFK